jgi:hypothetical protein
LVTAQHNAPSCWAGREADERAAVRVGLERQGRQDDLVEAGQQPTV